MKDCILGKDKFVGNIFWIDNDKRKDVMQHILTTPDADYPAKFKNTTEESIWNRYKDIEKYMDEKKLAKDKLQVFIMYFLERLVLVELKIDKDDTPMVFEVINDRGVALKPYEILKGKMIGALDKDDTETYSGLWENSLNLIRGYEDEFFNDYLKGKFIFKKNAELEKAVNNEYHRFMFADNDIANSLCFRKKDENHIKNIKSFIATELVYYTELYSKIIENNFIFLNYNYNINDLAGQYQNILAACSVKDKHEQSKIEVISKEIDRLYMLLRLNGIYSSNDFTEIQYNLNAKLPNKKPDEYREIFNSLLTQTIKEKRNVKEVHSVLDYDKFAMRGYEDIDTRPLRYFFARVEEYVCKNTGRDMENPVNYISLKTGHKTGYHVEHILARNDENKKYFKSEEEFEIRRNKLGGLLLLYNMDNIISSNEKYYDGKRKTYSNGLVWGRTLIETFYHKTNTRFDEFNKGFKMRTGLEFKPLDKFDNASMEYRSKLLYAIVKDIWEIE